MHCIQYELQREDLVAFADHHAAHAPYIVNRTRRMRWIWGILLGGLAVFQVQREPKLAAFTGALAVVYLLFYPRMTRYYYRRHNRRLYQDAGADFLGSCELTLDSNQLHSRSKLGESSINLSAIDRVESTDGYLFIYIGPANAIVLPKARVQSGDIEAFEGELATMANVEVR